MSTKKTKPVAPVHRHCYPQLIQAGERSGLKRKTLQAYLKSDLMEIADDTYDGYATGQPFYFHSARCIGGCDYGCNHRGFEIAKDCAAVDYEMYNS